MEKRKAHDHVSRAARGQHHHGAGAGEHAARDRHAGHSVAMFRTKFWVALALTIPALVWEPMLQE